MRWKNDKFTPLNQKGFYGEELGVAYISGYRVEMSEAEFNYYKKNVIEPHNESLNKQIYKLETYEERIERQIKQAKEIRQNIMSVSRQIKHMSFIQRMPDIVEGMKNQLADSANPQVVETKKKLDLILDTIQDMSQQELSDFYYKNSDLFEDMTDYYDWLKQHSGRYDKKTKPGRRGNKKSAQAYSNLMNRRLDQIIKKLKPYMK